MLPRCLSGVQSTYPGVEMSLHTCEDTTTQYNDGINNHPNTQPSSSSLHEGKVKRRIIYHVLEGTLTLKLRMLRTLAPASMSSKGTIPSTRNMIAVFSTMAGRCKFRSTFGNCLSLIRAIYDGTPDQNVAHNKTHTHCGRDEGIRTFKSSQPKHPQAESIINLLKNIFWIRTSTH